MKNFELIHYPFFGLKEKPFKISYSLNKIYLNKNSHSHKETVDDKSLEGDYFARLLQLDKRIQFDYTCKNLAQLIFQRPKWGMDSLAKPFDLSDLSYHVSLKLPVKKIRDNLIWFNKISYPFEIPTNEELSIPTDIFGILVSVNNEWYIQKFTFDEKDVNIRKKILL
jgi:hypothetical protein